jgi:XRE family aerobic/anaerobic benzoate catabolism transcriptional regulator
MRSRSVPRPAAPPAQIPDPKAFLAGVGARVRALRTARGESRAALAARAGLSLRFLAQLEAGTANISLLRLCEVAQALGAPLESLLGLGRAESPASAAEMRIRELLRARGADELAEVRDWVAARFAPASGPLVALLGLRGAGKSSVGARLAHLLGVPFFELDALIETAAGLALPQVFELHGEAYYRRLERETLARFLATTPAGVLATGGGLVTEPETYALLRRRCTTIWLRADPKLHWSRVVRQGDRRPMRDNPTAMLELRALLAAREPLYARAERTVDTSRRTVAQVATELARSLRRHAAAC